MRTLILLAAFAILLVFAVKQPNETVFDAATAIYGKVPDTPQKPPVQPVVTPPLPALPEIVVKERPTPKPVPLPAPPRTENDQMPAIEAMYREALRLLAEK